MVHHYLEEEEPPHLRSPTSVVTTEDVGVSFNCQITPPHREEKELSDLVEEETPPSAPQPVPARPCCPVTPPVPLVSGPSSELVEALPTIMIGIGIAYAVGMLSGAFIFSSPVE